MASMTPTIAINPITGHGGDVRPPEPGGGGDDGSGGESSNYGERLRRARLGMAVALIPISMLFVSFTSAYIVRQGLPTLDEPTSKYVRDWLSVNLPLTILLINTF